MSFLKQPREASRTGSQFPIVGIGASAGGLEAFTTFLKAVSPDLGMAFVLVAHLDPSRKSTFTQILSRATSMPVVEITDGLPVEPNHVYMIPPHCDLAIESGVLHIADRGKPLPLSTIIDIFMRSLAADRGANAIGIVLSGNLSDGTQGLIAIKSEGGITFAQDALSAKHDSMPASAIASGYVDMVLPPERIAEELVRIGKHTFVAGPPMEQIEEGRIATDASMEQVFQILRHATRVDFSEYKPPTIGRRIQRRMFVHRIEKLSDYVALLHRDNDEVNTLYQDLLINVTSFFRDPEAFDALKRVVYPAILQARGSSHGPIRIWVPGCSTGEETYSHAISLVEFLGDERKEIPIQIFGTDLSELAIHRARAGIYKESIETDVSQARLRRFFQKCDGGYQISKTIRDLCVFSTQNIFSDPPFSRMDLVSCRNVLIYLSQSLQKKVVPIFHYALNPTGFLMIGNTEGLLGTGSELFEMTENKQKIYRKKLVSTPVTFGFAVGRPEQGVDGAATTLPAPRAQEIAKAPLELHREADRLLLARYAPPAVVINDQLEILQSRGPTGPFLSLPPGKASLNLLKMARPGLLFELQNAVDEARKTGTEIVREKVRVDGDGGTRLINVRVIPFRTPAQDQNSYLTIFEPAEFNASLPPVARPLTPAEQSEKDRQIAQLTQEIAAIREYLQSIIESQEATNQELQAANEEIQSGNEELQSTNEELQTSKEELESANEELHTVNEEMQRRNELLTRLNNDLTNLMNSINLAMVTVGSDLSVRWFTPQATAMLGVTAKDVGHTLPRLEMQVDGGNLEQKIREAVQKAQAKQFDLHDGDGKVSRLRISAYRTQDDRVDGAVLTFVDGTGPLPPEPARTGAQKKAVKKNNK